jgi:hypothetical protein
MTRLATNSQHLVTSGPGLWGAVAERWGISRSLSCAAVGLTIGFLGDAVVAAASR